MASRASPAQTADIYFAQCRPPADDVSISSPLRQSPGSVHSSGRAAAYQELSRGPSAASDTSGRSLGSRLSSQQAASSVTSLAGQQEMLKGHEAAVTDVIFAPDGRNVASASADGVVSPLTFSRMRWITFAQIWWACISRTRTFQMAL